MSSSFHTDLQVKHAATSPRYAFFLLLLIDEVACHVTSSNVLVVFMRVCSVESRDRRIAQSLRAFPLLLAPRQ